MRRALLFIRFLLIFFVTGFSTLSAQAYFRVIGGIPHLPVLKPSAVSSPFAGMLIYSPTDGMPMMYNGAGWESLCGGDLTAASSVPFFEVRQGIPYLTILGTDPSNSAGQGSVYLSATQKALMIHDGTGWTRLSYLKGKSIATPKAQFSTDKAFNISKLPVLNGDPAPAGLLAGAIYMNAATGFLRYYTGTVWKDIRCMPLIQTLPVTSLTGSKANTGVRIVSLVGPEITVQGLCWGLSPNPAIETSARTTNQNLSGFPVGDYPATISGLMANTTYHVRAYAITSTGAVIYGEDVSFTTKDAELPTIATNCPVNVNPTQADGGGDVTDWGGARITLRGVYMTSDPAYKDAPYLDPRAYKSNDGSGQGVFPSGLTGLLTNTTYYVQAYAENKMGVGYGPVCTFTTPPPSPPVLSSPTVNITNITDNSAMGEVVIINNGGSLVLERGIRYSIDKINWTYVPSNTVNSSDIGTFIVNLSDLLPGTLYYVQAYATNSIGTSYSSESSLVTSSLPTVRTLEVFNYNTATFRWGSLSSLDGTVAIVNAQVISTGASTLTEYGVCWSTDPDFDPARVPLNQKVSQSGGSTGIFYMNLKELLPNTTYYVTAFASNAQGTNTGKVISFTTPRLPEVSTQLATDPATIISSAAISTGGRVTDDGGVPVIARGICWSIGADGMPDLNDSYTGNGSGLGAFISTIKNLQGSTAYTIRAYATSHVGTAYGEPVTLITNPPVAPSLSTNAVYNIAGNAAMGGGLISSDGGAPVEIRGICWNTDGEPTIDKDNFTSAGSGAGNFNAMITALTPDTWYYVRAYAKNGAAPVVYGNEVKFRTFTLPTLVTVGAIAGSVTSSSAQIEGAILADGGSKITQSGICYSIDSQPTLSNPYTIGGPGTGNFIHTLTGLMGNTTYTVRAYAINGAGTAYANDIPEITFTTAPPIPPSLTTLAASAITGNSAISGGNVSSHGGSLLVEVGVCWSTKKGFDPETESMGRASQKGSASFKSTLSGLLPGTTYYIRAYARNAVGTAYATNEISFTTLNLATVSTDLLVPGSVTSTSALVQGTVARNGGSYVSRNGICWSSTNPMPTIEDEISSPVGAGIGSFTASMTGLMGNTTYYVRAYATNAAGTAYGDPAIVVTTDPAVAPTLKVLTVSFPSRTETQIKATITSNGGGNMSTRGVVWSTYPMADPSTVQNERTAQTGYGIGDFDAIITNLNPGTIYYVWAYAVSEEAGPAYSEMLSFRTPDVPLVTTLMPVYGNTTANLGGIVIEDGGAELEMVGFAWSTQAITDLDAVPATNKIILAGSSNFSAKLTGLKPQTTYYLVAFAGNMMGIGQGQQLSFTTDLASLPMVLTTDASNVGGTMATLGGNITDNGGADIINRGIVYSTEKDFDPLSVPVSNVIHLSGASSGGVFSSTLLNLSKGTTYFYRAYADNNVGKVFGDQKEFTTLNVPQLSTWADVSSDPAQTLLYGGNISSDGGSKLISYGLCWSTLPMPTISLLTKTEYKGGDIGVFRDMPTGLLPVTTYYVRAYATNAIGTNYGDEVILRTPPVLATIQTTDAIVNSVSTAISGGKILKDGGAPITERGLIWSTKKGFDPETDPHETMQEIPQGLDNTFSLVMTGLRQGITYYVRAYAVNAAGTAYGLPVSFSILATSPILNTRAIVNIKGVVANGGGEVVSDGGSALIRTGVCWATHENPTINDAHTSNDPSMTFSSTLTGLQPNTHYWVRAYAENGVGIAYGLPVDFITATVPTLTATGPISEIRSASATVGGEITDDGRLPITDRGFVWSIYNDPAKAGANKTVDKSSSIAERFNAKISTGLSPDTDYYVWAYASNEVGTTYASPILLRTLKLMPPVVITQDLDLGKVTGNSAEIKAEVTDDGGDPVTARGVCWSTEPNPVHTLNTRIANGTGVGKFTSVISGLQPKTHYYVRAYARNGVDVSYSEPALEFTTSAVPPTLGTITINNIKISSADATSLVSNDGGDLVTVRGFIWSKSSIRPVADAANSVQVSDSNLPFNAVLGQLEANTKYYVWAYATNSAGTGYSSTPVNFTTLSLASVLTNAPSSITGSSAKVGGNVTSTGGGNITERGIYWGTTNPPELDDAHKLIFVTSSTTTGSYTLDLTGLNKGTEYWVQAYAISAAGTVYGQVQKLTTLNVPVLTTSKPKDYSIAAGKAVGGGNITLDGGSKILTRGILWSDTETDPTKVSASNKTTENIASGTGLGAFTATMTGLSVGKVYHVWAYASNAVGTAYGDMQTLITPVALPTLSALTLGTVTASTADLTAKVIFDGGAPIEDKGLIWNTTGVLPESLEMAENRIPDISLGSNIAGQLSGLIEGPTYYVWAYASNSAGTAYSLVEDIKLCPADFTVVHMAGLNGAPVDKTVTYRSVSTKISGMARCWITQNLGADQQATSATDATESSAGWYWQFNRSQGYQYTTSRTPATAWNPSISENKDWEAGNDPCNLLLGGGWRLPTATEWTNADGAPQNWGKAADAYNSVLKLHLAGNISTLGTLQSRGSVGYYWGSTSADATNGSVLSMSSPSSSVTSVNKANAMPIRCLRDQIIPAKPSVSKVELSNMTTNTALGSAVVTLDGGSAVTDRGLVWNTTGNPGLSDHVLKAGAGLGTFNAGLSGLVEGPTYYVRAYATNAQGTTYGPEESFKVCPAEFIVIHKAGLNGAPVDKTVTYHSVNTKISGASACWITQNLGSDREATSFNDNTEASAGWYWQFNRSQGYQYTTSRTPATAWNYVSENKDWEAGNDPCNLLLGGGWRLPTATEWTNADAAPQNWGKAADAYNSVLKLHLAGNVSTLGFLQSRGSSGYYWGSTSLAATNGSILSISSTSSNVTSVSKDNAMPIRCLRDQIIPAKPSVSMVELSNMTTNTALGSAVVTLDGGAPVTERGLVWNTSGNPSLWDNVLRAGLGLGTFNAGLSGLVEGPTYYVRAYATNAQGTTYGLEETFKICPAEFTVIHKAGANGAPVDKTVTYHSVNTKISGAAACWITQNLGADREATIVSDNTEASAGWYWQFNRSKGYQYTISRTPATAWNPSINENKDWEAGNDPCNLLLGGGWRLPTATEWTKANAAPQNWGKAADAYNSVLKLHLAGDLNASGNIESRGSLGYYWSSTSANATAGSNLSMSSTSSTVSSVNKAIAISVRCLRD